MFIVEIVRKDQSPYVKREIFKTLEKAQISATYDLAFKYGTAKEFRIYEISKTEIIPHCVLVSIGEIGTIAWRTPVQGAE